MHTQKEQKQPKKTAGARSRMAADAKESIEEETPAVRDNMTKCEEEAHLEGKEAFWSAKSCVEAV